MSEPPCVKCKKEMPEEWLSENCPCVERKCWEANQEASRLEFGGK